MLFKNRFLEEGKWGNRALGAGLGALGATALMTGNDDVNDTINNWHELDNKDQLWNHFMDKGQQGLEYLKGDNPAEQIQAPTTMPEPIGVQNVVANPNGTQPNSEGFEAGRGLTPEDRSAFGLQPAAPNAGLDNYIQKLDQQPEAHTYVGRGGHAGGQQAFESNPQGGNVTTDQFGMTQSQIPESAGVQYKDTGFYSNPNYDNQPVPQSAPQPTPASTQALNQGNNYDQPAAIRTASSDSAPASDLGKLKAAVGIGGSSANPGKVEITDPGYGKLGDYSKGGVGEFSNTNSPKPETAAAPTSEPKPVQSSASQYHQQAQKIGSNNFSNRYSGPGAFDKNSPNYNAELDKTISMF